MGWCLDQGPRGPRVDRQESLQEAGPLVPDWNAVARVQSHQNWQDLHEETD